MRTSIAFASTSLLLLLAGCGGPDTFVCQPQCPGGSHCAASGCVSDTPSCQPACPGGSHCTANGCVSDTPGSPDMAAPANCEPACGMAAPYCNASHTCVGCLVDANCGPGQVCKSAGATTSCVAGCADDSRCAAGGNAAMKCCGGQCFDTSKDTQNCGTCGTACGAQHSSAVCTNSACMAGKCTPGWGDCNSDPKDGCETNVHISPTNCTACGMKCAFPHATAGCSDGCYIATCDFGWADCNNDMNNADGCEKDVSADAMNCGDCGNKCGAVPHAKNACVSSFCQLTSCDQGYSDCNGVAKDGCEVATGTDASNCGKCGNVCQQGLVCLNSSCTCPMCVIPHSKTRCDNNQCVWDSCLPNYGNCDNDNTNGCEINLLTDPKNCSNCGSQCPQNTPYCFQGACQAKLPGELIGTLMGQDFYKVQVMGAMTDTNVSAACINSGFRVPCQSGAPGSCMYDDNSCAMSQENGCGSPMASLARAICNGQSPSNCPAVFNCFQYMGHKWVNDSACGALQGQWCVQGSNAMNGFAVCVM